MPLLPVVDYTGAVSSIHASKLFWIKASRLLKFLKFLETIVFVTLVLISE